jgi:hypothetical protein
MPKKYGQHDSSVNEINRLLKNLHWRHCSEKWFGCTTLKSIRYNPLFLDYLGLCIWDSRRHGFFGLAPLYEKFPGEYSGLLRNPEYFSNASEILSRWANLLMRELIRLPGGEWRLPSKELKILAEIGVQQLKDIPIT